MCVRSKSGGTCAAGQAAPTPCKRDRSEQPLSKRPSPPDSADTLSARKEPTALPAPQWAGVSPHFWHAGRARWVVQGQIGPSLRCCVQRRANWASARGAKARLISGIPPSPPPPLHTRQVCAYKLHIQHRRVHIIHHLDTAQACACKPGLHYTQLPIFTAAAAAGEGGGD